MLSYPYNKSNCKINTTNISLSTSNAIAKFNALCKVATASANEHLNYSYIKANVESDEDS